MGKILTDTLIYTLKAAPALAVIYVLWEFLRIKTGFSSLCGGILKNKFAQAAGAAAGLAPYPGFPQMAAEIYSKRLLSTGTLLAIFISSSGEAVPILLSGMPLIGKLVPLLFVLFSAAVIAGLIVDLVKKRNIMYDIQEFDGIIEKYSDKTIERPSVRETKNAELRTFLYKPLLRFLKVIAVIAVTVFFYNSLVYSYGAIAVGRLFTKSMIFMPLLVALIGFIPDFAASAVITQLFALNVISLGTAAAGLITNTGFSLSILSKYNYNRKENYFVAAALYITGAAAGIISSFIF